ncbi:hypothetical protein PACTADRAFT_50036 [Pachysolen tannophilus NRRL Y-2460]|uniref:MICOS complex subunit n=1 Tax=Pachysolen tannophilus NRRL Y-2460 TaxID=669874 RepID=A0A1E4TU80_PACTA|nr:hypothetical protein PACTADRAFT_50036 [Pachysolen tannophilus NRRL Y-2460]
MAVFYRSVKAGTFLVGASSTLLCLNQLNNNANSIILNESTRRDFYEDDDQITPIPGTVIPASASELEVLGPNKLVSGVSVRSPSVLENFFKSVRQESLNYYQNVENKFNELTDKYYTKEREVTSTISSLHDRREDLFPNSIYIVVGTLAGTIVARRRNILIRALSPLVFGLFSFAIFLPQTFENSKKLVWKLEQKNLPEFASRQKLAAEKVDSLVNDVEKTAGEGKRKIDSTIKDTRKLIADVTGLNIDQEVTKKGK